MTNRLGVILMILLGFFVIVYYSNGKEGMSTLDVVDESNSDVSVYYGEFGTLRIRTMPNGDRVVVAVKRNMDYVENKEIITVYGADGDTVYVYVNEDGEYLVIDNNTVDEDTVIKSTSTYYGNHGSVTISTDEDGDKHISDYKVNEDDTVGIHTFYGPQGNSVDIIRTPDGDLKIVDTGNGKTLYVNTKNDYIRKTEIVPPVCPACPSVTTCASADGNCGDKSKEEEQEEISNTFTSVTGPRRNTVTQGKNGGTVIQGKSGTDVVIGPKGNAVASKDSNVVMRDTSGTTIIRTPEGNVRADTKIGMYLGDNSVINQPMPILNSFSTFGR